ncbi:MAG TPA: hypothetical protein VI146_08520 [Nitrososphaeraceae archaeon]
MLCPYCNGSLGLKVEIVRHYSLANRIQTVGEDGREGPPTFTLDSYVEAKNKFLYPSIECINCNRKFYEAGLRAQISEDNTRLVLPNFTKNKIKADSYWDGRYCYSSAPKASDEKFVLKERPRDHDNSIG